MKSASASGAGLRRKGGILKRIELAAEAKRFAEASGKVAEMAREVGVHDLLRPIRGELRQHVAFSGGGLVLLNPLSFCPRHEGYPCTDVQGTQHARGPADLPRFRAAMHVIHRPATLPASSREVVQGGPAGVLGLFQRGKGRTGDPDGTHIGARRRAPRRDITVLPAEARAGPALVADDERESIAHRAPYLHIGNEVADTVKREIDCWHALAQ